jgi:hypothetical protein
MTGIRTGNNRRRAKAKFDAMVGRNRYVVLEVEAGVPANAEMESIAAMITALTTKMNDVGPDMRSMVDIPGLRLHPLLRTNLPSVQEIVASLEKFENPQISVMPRFADYHSILHHGRARDRDSSDVSALHADLARLVLAPSIDPSGASRKTAQGLTAMMQRAGRDELERLRSGAEHDKPQD